MKLSPNFNMDNTHLLTYGPWLRLGMSNVKHACLMYITSRWIHLDQWKSFMKFGIKKSHEMISYNLDWIALLSKWEYEMSTKPYYLAQMTLIEIYNKSHEGLVWTNVKKRPQLVENLNSRVNETLLWPRWRISSCTRYEVWPLIKVEFWVEYNQLYFWTKTRFNF